MTTAYTASNSVPMTALPTTNGIIQKFVANATNTGNDTFAPDGLVAAPIYGLGGQPLQGNEIVKGGIATLSSFIEPLLNSDALCWVLLSCEGGAQQVANATQSQQAVTLGQILNVMGATPGDIKFSAANAVPVGWLEANGALVSRSTYQALFTAIGTTYGAGDGSTTFALPDLRGQFVRGFDDGRGVDADRVFGSSQLGTIYAYDTSTTGTADGTWNVSTTQNVAAASQQAIGVDNYSTSDYPTVSVSAITPTDVRALPNIAGDQGYTGVVRPTNVALLPLIKY